MGFFFLTYLALNVKKESIKTDADYIGNKNDQLTHEKGKYTMLTLKLNTGGKLASSLNVWKLSPWLLQCLIFITYTLNIVLSGFVYMHRHKIQDSHQSPHGSWVCFHLRYLTKKWCGHSQESLLWPSAEPVYGTTRHQWRKLPHSCTKHLTDGTVVEKKKNANISSRKGRLHIKTQRY